MHFIGILSNVDSSISKITLEHGFKIEKIDSPNDIELLSALETIPALQISRRIFWPLYCHNDFGIIVISKETEYYFESKDPGNFEGMDKVNDFNNDVVDKYLLSTLRLMRLYKEGNISMNLWYYYCIEDNVPGTFMRYGESQRIEKRKYSLEDSEVPNVMKFIESVELPFKMNYLDLAFQNFELSYQINNSNLKFLTLMTGMEILFNPSDRELRYRISRNLATLIGKDENDSELIFNRMYKSKIDGEKGLYNIRSEIVHEGNPRNVREEDILELRDYLRRAIKEANKVGKEKKELNEMLHASGFGEKPWRDD